PSVLGDVPAVHEHRFRVPVAHLPRQEIPPLQQQDLLARTGQGMREGAAPGSGPDDDHVIVLGHGYLLLPMSCCSPGPGGSITHKGGPCCQMRDQISRSWRARRTASPRWGAARLWEMFLICDLTVLLEIYSSPAISAVVSRLETCRSTSRSRSVSGSTTETGVSPAACEAAGSEPQHPAGSRRCWWAPTSSGSRWSTG